MSNLIASTSIFWFQLEQLVRDMQDDERGVPVRSQKMFLTSIPAAFMGETSSSVVNLVGIVLYVDLRLSYTTIVVFWNMNDEITL